MATVEKQSTGLPKVVKQAEWQKALDEITAKEKSQTKSRDALAAERRRLPMVKIEKDYQFDSPRGKVSLLDLFERRRELIIYHFMFAPSVPGWPEAGCVGCSMVGDQVANLAHLRARGVSFYFVSLAPLANIEAYKKRMGWDIPWVSSAGSDFNVDFNATRPEGEHHGLSVFLRDGDDVYRTYFTTDRGCETLGPVWSFLDLTPFGRQEEWEDTPSGRPQSAPYVWWHRHDEYGPEAKAK
jgi:predicted dithiol-disulfide oxidoreductase (DUF899 family)